MNNEASHPTATKLQSHRGVMNAETSSEFDFRLNDLHVRMAGTGRALSARQIAAELGTSHTQINHITNRALAKLKTALAEKGVTEAEFELFAALSARQRGNLTPDGEVELDSVFSTGLSQKVGSPNFRARRAA